VELLYKLLIILFVKYYINHPFLMQGMDKEHIDRMCLAGLELA